MKIFYTEIVDIALLHNFQCLVQIELGKRVSGHSYFEFLESIRRRLRIGPLLCMDQQGKQYSCQ